MSDDTPSDELKTLTTQIVSAHVSHNTVAVSDLPALIKKIYHTLAGASSEAPPAPERPQPAVPINKSITPAYVVCLEDGRKLKTLKRHLRTAYNMSLDEYRAKWGLAPDYPMVAPDYAAQRSAMAKMIGLGRRATSATRKKSK
ncbi:MAG: MucR family transcriptional regulator [Alphaproteobacteria bacterium]